MTPAPTDTTSNRILFLAGSTNATVFKRGRLPIPLTMPVRQAYYWSAEWQRAEAESLADYKSGRYIESDDPEDIIRWLDESDEQ